MPQFPARGAGRCCVAGCTRIAPACSSCLQADFSYYFDTGGRRRCYLAPERFFEGSPGAINTAAPLQPDMVRQRGRDDNMERERERQRGSACSLTELRRQPCPSTSTDGKQSCQQEAAQLLLCAAAVITVLRQ